MNKLISHIYRGDPIDEFSENIQLNTSVQLIEAIMLLIQLNRNREREILERNNYAKSILHLFLDRGVPAEPLSNYLSILMEIIDVDLLHKLLENGLSVDAQDEGGGTLLMHLVEYYKDQYRVFVYPNIFPERIQEIEETIIALLEHDPSPDASLQAHNGSDLFVDGSTVIHHIAQMQPMTRFIFEIFEYLATPDNINIMDNHGFTPLVEYIQYRSEYRPNLNHYRGENEVTYQEMIDLMEAKGANFLFHYRSDFNNGRNWGALELAQEERKGPELIRIIQEKIQMANEKARRANVQGGRMNNPPHMVSSNGPRIVNIHGGKNKSRKGRKTRIHKGKKTHRRHRK